MKHTVSRLWSEVGGWHTEGRLRKKPGPPSSGVPRQEAARYRARRWARQNAERVRENKATYYRPNRAQILADCKERYDRTRRVLPPPDRRCQHCGNRIPDGKRPQAKWCSRSCGNTRRVREFRSRSQSKPVEGSGR